MAKFKLLAETSDVKIVLNGQVADCIMVAEGSTVEWEVSAEGYVTQSGSEVVNEDTTKEVYLLLKDVTVKVVPDMENLEGLKVVINGVERTEYTGKWGESVKYEVSADNCETAEGEVVLSEDMEVVAEIWPLPMIFRYNHTGAIDVLLGFATTVQPSLSTQYLFVLGGSSSSHRETCSVVVNNGEKIEVEANSFSLYEYLSEGVNEVKIYHKEALESSADTYGINGGSANGSESGPMQYLIAVDSWGALNVRNGRTLFYYAINLESIAKLEDINVNSSSSTFVATSMFYNANVDAIPDGFFEALSGSGMTTFGGDTFERCLGAGQIKREWFGNKEFTAVTSIQGLFRYMWRTELEEVPAEIFALFPNVTDVTQVFYGTVVKNCDIPANIFANCKKITVFERCFDANYNTSNDKFAGGESPYDLVEIDGVETKIHLYERADYPSIYATPTSYSNCFRSQTKLDDYDQIPSAWGGGGE